MVSTETTDSLKQAFKELLDAEIELNRPQEDVVTLSACQSVRNSMKHMMRCFLDAHTLPVKENASLTDLRDQCMQINPMFAGIDLRDIECKGIDHAHCDGRYCLAIENVAICLTTANKLKSLVAEELK